MRKCTRFHIEDVEAGDKLTLVNDEESIEIIVSSKVKTNNFGWIFRARIDGKHKDFYLEDYDEVNVSEATK